MQRLSWRKSAGSCGVAGYAERRVAASNRWPRHPHDDKSGHVEGYWPHATTLFDYVRRAMPFQAPGSLTADEVYAVSAYILSEANIIEKTMVLDAQTLPRVQMPNRDGFIPDPRPELFK